MLTSSVNSVGEGGAVHGGRRAEVLKERRERYPDVSRRKPNDTSGEREGERREGERKHNTIA